MKIDNEKYEIYLEHINTLKKKGKPWEEIINLGPNDTSTQQTLNVLASLKDEEEITVTEWKELVEEVYEMEKSINITTLGRNTKNDAKIPNTSYSSWGAYRQKLEDQGFSERSINNIQNSSYEVLKSLQFDTRKTGPIKGLVMGNVQSGKTANMAGLMAMAADNGFNYFIVLSGVIENLRQQTANRLYNDLKYPKVSTINKWNRIDNPSTRSKDAKDNISNFNLNEKSKEKYFTVCLKNKGRLTSLFNWLKSDPNKAKQLKILVIDDEADQASINTKDIEEDTSTINKLIKDIVNDKSFLAMNYISYTATPYANVLNETANDSLYPKDFITLLEPSEDYIGPKQIFGTEMPEQSPKVDIIKEISDTDANLVKDIQKGETNQNIPKSFKEAIQWFILTVCSMRALSLRKPISMLIHTSFKIDHHELLADKVQKYIKDLKDNYSEEIIDQFKTIYQQEMSVMNRPIFIEGMKEYSTPENVPEYPSWDKVKYQLDSLINLDNNEFISHIPLNEEKAPVFHRGIHLAIDNSRTKINNQHVRLIYPEKNNMPEVAPAFIVIGGNTLSRGLTLEGLTTTYFLRTTNQADTLMQMGRWFGYRKGYEIFPRVWLDNMANKRFLFLSQMNEELRDEIKQYAENGSTPIDFAPRIKNSPNYQLIRITSNNKQQSAEGKEFNFYGFNSQTVYFEKNEKVLTHNLEITNSFLNNITEPQIKSNKLVWKDIDTQKVKDFLLNYKVSEVDTKMRALPALVEWLEKNGGDLQGWSVILSGTGRVDDNHDSDWMIQGLHVNSVIRTKLVERSREDVISIGTLRVPNDLYADIDATLEKNEGKSAKMVDVRNTREKYGYGNTPQLIIYRINKGDKDFKIINSNSREKLDFPKDIIGINIMLPGVSRGNKETYISAKINLNNEIVDEDEFSEDFERED
ncbi:hypothetical protein E2558_06260 [Staphylococcus pragensis]|uniref:Putative endonuclease Z1 domain-containing protein n=1 Tax=Staphylococcus pragensis TaxID=1611836 RepID=A0A4Z1BXZ6_9STAP|nr:Z1 domain-containing protein [Staphylococcus pragensis]RTX90005.1 hypothetical protein CD154_05845 [Staphylococcus carnosus]TGN27445.1 hypothetical protein E2558_06260 [Staphylococcus pragensis]GGG92711.1 hypothetical protein GCM10007342_14400 [Staphylococcus pragensis]